MSSATHPAGPPPTMSFEALLAGLEAAGEVTRLRLIGLLCEAELTVSELVAILGQSQPRVSRHLKLLVEAGLAERQREGAWAFYRLADKGGALARALIARIEPADPTLAADRARLAVAREARRRAGRRLFRRARGRLGRDPRPARAGGTGRSRDPGDDRREADPRRARSRHRHRAHARTRRAARRARRRRRPEPGDAGPRPLAHRPERAAQRAIAPGRHLRAADRTRRLRSRHHPPGAAFSRRSRARAQRSGARACAPAGRLLVVDFAAHGEEFLREQFAHRRLGFANEEIEAFVSEAGLRRSRAELVPPEAGEPGKLTVALWLARDPRVISDDLPKAAMELA